MYFISLQGIPLPFMAALPLASAARLVLLPRQSAAGILTGVRPLGFIISRE